MIDVNSLFIYQKKGSSLTDPEDLGKSYEISSPST